MGKYLFVAVYIILQLIYDGDTITPYQSEGDADLEMYLREALENLRTQMPIGIPEIKMPVLDPLHLKNLDINIDENIAKLKLKLEEMIIRHLSEFTIVDLVPNLEEYFIKISLLLPKLRAEGSYEMEGKLLKIFPLNGNGSYLINITEVEVFGEGQLQFLDDTLQITTFNLDFNWLDLDVYLENFLGGGKFSEALQKLLPKIGKSILSGSSRTEITKLLNKAVSNEINKVLRKPNVKEIIKGIIPH